MQTVDAHAIWIAYASDDPADDAEWESFGRVAVYIRAQHEGLNIERYSTEVVRDPEGNRAVLVVGHLAEESR